MHKLVNNNKQYLLKLVGSYGIDYLTEGKEYKTVNGIEEGIFADRPYVTIKNDKGTYTICHASRFEIVKELENVIIK